MGGLSNSYLTMHLLNWSIFACVLCFHKDNFYLSFLHKKRDNFYGLVGSNGSATQSIKFALIVNGIVFVLDNGG